MIEYISATMTCIIISATGVPIFHNSGDLQGKADAQALNSQERATQAEIATVNANTARINRNLKAEKYARLAAKRDRQAKHLMQKSIKTRELAELRAKEEMGRHEKHSS